jgi:hypothetical protein
MIVSIYIHTYLFIQMSMILYSCTYIGTIEPEFHTHDGVLVQMSLDLYTFIYIYTNEPKLKMKCVFDFRITTFTQ